MVHDLIFCKDCIRKLAIYGKNSVETYKYICVNYSNNHSIFCKSGKKGLGVFTIQLLEKRKFIITCDSFDGLLNIRPLGFLINTQNTTLNPHMVCAFRNEHKKTVNEG